MGCRNLLTLSGFHCTFSSNKNICEFFCGIEEMEVLYIYSQIGRQNLKQKKTFEKVLGKKPERTFQTKNPLVKASLSY